MSADPTSRDALAAYVVAAAQALDLTVRPEWLDGVTTNLAITLRLARLVDAFPLPDEAEPVPVFKS